MMWQYNTDNIVVPPAGLHPTPRLNPGSMYADPWFIQAVRKRHADRTPKVTMIVIGLVKEMLALFVHGFAQFILQIV